MKRPHREPTESVHTTERFAAVVRRSGGKPVLSVRNPTWYETQLGKFRDGEEVSLVVTSKKPKRSLAQNNYYWLYIGVISKETGHAPEEIHEWAKGKFLTEKIINVFGSPVRMKGSTTRMSKSEFSEYIQRIESETGIPSPPTDDEGL